MDDGIAGITAPTSDKASAKAYDKTGYRSKPPGVAAQALLQRPTILSLDQDLHWARRLTYGIARRRCASSRPWAGTRTWTSS